MGLLRYLDWFSLLFHPFTSAVGQNWSEFWTAKKNFKVRAALCGRLQRAQGLRHQASQAIKEM
jgi:hypothetical protein